MSNQNYADDGDLVNSQDKQRSRHFNALKDFSGIMGNLYSDTHPNEDTLKVDGKYLVTDETLQQSNVKTSGDGQEISDPNNMMMKNSKFLTIRNNTKNLSQVLNRDDLKNLSSIDVGSQ